MKLKRIGIMVLAAAMLVATTGVTASAAKYTFSGEFVTTLASDNSVVINYHSYGSKDVSSGDSLAWWFRFKNMKTQQRYGKDTQTTSPSGGLSPSETSGWYTVPAGDGVNPGDSGEYEFPATLNSLTSHTIYEVHRYNDGTYNWYSPANDMMSYY